MILHTKITKAITYSNPKKMEKVNTVGKAIVNHPQFYHKCMVSTIKIWVWVNCNISLPWRLYWIIGDNSPLRSPWFQGSVTTWGHEFFYPTGRSVITNWVNIIDLVQHMYTYLYVVGERNWNQASKISIQTSHPSTFTRVFSWFVLPSVHLVSWESVTGTDTIRYF